MTTGILEGDIKLLASARLADTDDGGGRMTGIEVATGQHNTVVPDISDIDRAYGRVNLRELFLAVETDNTDVYYGSHIIVSQPPADPNVSITLFATGGHFDERLVAQDLVESYLARGPRWQGYLYDTQLKGQRAIRLFQRRQQRLPEVGEVFFLVGDEGKVTEFSQPVRVTGVSSEERTFLVSGSSQEFVRTVVTAEISTQLQFTFAGNLPTPYDDQPQATGFRESVVADAAQYYGTVPLKVAAQFGSMQLQAETIFTQLVPSSRIETPAIDLTAGGQSSTLTPSGNGVVTLTSNVSIAANRSFYLGTGAEPGTVTLKIGAATIKDSGGELLLGGTVVGSIAYARGLLTFNGQCPDYGVASKTIMFSPAGSVTRVSDTMSLAIKENTRGYAYTATLKPIPDPGSLTISYLSQGKWYDLRDNGKGELLGADAAYGSGTLSFTTGSLMVTLGALPDTGSAILFSWGSPTTSFNRANTPVGKVGVRGVIGTEVEFNARAWGYNLISSAG